MSSLPGIQSVARSVVGHVRRANEDAFLDAREQRLWVVADGMGGHSRGDRASQAIVSALLDFEATRDAVADLEKVQERLQEANRWCREASDGKVMGSTVAALYINGPLAYVIWAGDSRVYRVRHGELVQLTDDHSLVQELYRLGELDADEAEHHPASNVITRAVGVGDTLDLQVRQISVQSGDRYLICSDGLFKDLDRKDVANRLMRPAPVEALDALIDEALRRGGGDNVTAIVVQVPNTKAGVWPRTSVNEDATEAVGSAG